MADLTLAAALFVIQWSRSQTLGALEAGALGGPLEELAESN